MAETLKHTPLHDLHVRLGARMMPFAGFDMPVQYAGILEEHHAVRNKAGLFDVSHMGEVRVSGPKAFDFVQHLVSNDASRLYDGRAMYGVMCNENGGIVDDLLTYRLSETEYWLVINASNIEKDWAWMQANNPMGATLENLSDNIALMAIQGPKSIEIVQALTDVAVSELKYYHFLKPEAGTFFGSQHALLSRTGYTGELGLEIYCEAECAPAIWEALMDAGAAHGLQPIGLGARDTLRLEAGFCLYGNDLTDETDPFSAGLGWVTKLSKGDFVGSAALRVIKEAGPTQKLVGFVLQDRGIPRAGYAIVNADGEEMGTVTSGSQSPILGQGIGLGYVENNPAYTNPDQTIGIQVRNRTLAATVKKPPFHK